MKKFLFLIWVLTVNLEAIAKEVDLSTMSDPAGTFSIAFCARASPDITGKPGHAFVSFSHRPFGGQRDFLAIGHTVSAGVGVKEAGWSYFGSPVSGMLQEEKYTSIKQQCLEVQVNKTDYELAHALTTPALQLMGIVQPGGTVFQAYKLGAEDCVTFMIKVANVLKSRGLNVPVRGATEAPMAYMQRLIAAN